MRKLLAEPTGQFQLFDLSSGEMLNAHRPSVVLATNFFQDRIGRGQVLVLGQLKDEATDEDFEETWRESAGDRQLAIDSFLSEFAITAAEPAEPRKPRRGKRSGDAD